MSSDNPPDLHMLNVVVRDMAASLDFYRRLGGAGCVPRDASGAHVQLKMPGGFSLELDTAESARLWHAGWRADRPAPGWSSGSRSRPGRPSTTATPRRPGRLPGASVAV